MEIEFISVCLRAAVKNEWGRGDGLNPAVCTADAAAPKTVFPPQKFSAVSRRTSELKPADFCEKTQLRHKQLDVPSLLRACRVPAGYESEVT